MGANVNYYKVLSIVVADLSLSRRGSAHAVIQPMARRRRRTSLMNYFPQNADQGLSRRDAFWLLLPATIERHGLKSGGSIAITYLPHWVDRRR